MIGICDEDCAFTTSDKHATAYISPILRDRPLEIWAEGRATHRGLHMAQWHGKSRRKNTGGRNVLARGKRRTEISTEKQWAYIGEPKRKNYRRTGGNPLTRVLVDNSVSVANRSTGKVEKAKIINVLENPCDSNYVRRNILTKGAVIETDKGQVRITSRPGKDGVINGVLID